MQILKWYLPQNVLLALLFSNLIRVYSQQECSRSIFFFVRRCYLVRDWKTFLESIITLILILLQIPLNSFQSGGIYFLNFYSVHCLNRGKHRLRFTLHSSRVKIVFLFPLFPIIFISTLLHYLFLLCLTLTVPVKALT